MSGTVITITVTERRGHFYARSTERDAFDLICPRGAAVTCAALHFGVDPAHVTVEPIDGSKTRFVAVLTPVRQPRNWIELLPYMVAVALLIAAALVWGGVR